ncbi:lipid A export permease/ATP-binding protein MsbA [Marinicella sediminis]|uniref:Lipid A export permease/ATP-binding protein MsbA n=1 Tax=Marinicella sediminis TaxID=1792834 RepID=A0ABV7JBM6_9GAMM|nr:lipid A export permease/ATP-binding protein MsbA [Marinicella sediminis]
MTAEHNQLTYLGLLRHVKPYRLVFVIAILGAVIDAAMKGLFTWMLSPILENGFAEQDTVWVKYIPLFVIGVFLIRSVGNFAASYGFTWVGRKVINDLRRKVFNQYLVLPQRFYDAHSSGGLISRIIYDIEQMANGVSKNFVIIIREMLGIVFYLGVMFYYSWELALVAFVVFPVIALIIRLINKRFRRIGHGIQQSIAETTQTVEEVVKGHKIVKIFKGQDKEQRKFALNIRKNRQLQVKIVATQEVMSSINLMLVAIALSVIMYIAASSGMGPYDFMSFMTAMLLLMPTIKNLSNVFSTIQTTMAAADSVMSVLQQEPEKDTGSDRLDADQIELSFQHVDFSYSEEVQALRDISLSISKGQSVAFVGASGGGKTTLVNLVPRFYDVTGGEIRLNGRNIQDFTLDSLREHISMVSQEVVLFNDTVRNNIAYGQQTDCDDEAIIKAAEQANALAFIEALPQGFDTELGDNGTRLSGGQRQRIAIARAILKDAPLLILDEATSALDTESEKHIQEALQRLMKNRTTLVIAHRLSTIEHVDQVVVLNHGQVAQVGTHAELLAVPGIYAQLQQSQMLVRQGVADRHE